MGGRALPDTAKKRVKRADIDKRTAAAVAAYQAELARPLAPGERRRGARHFAPKGISYSTIVRHAEGGVPLSTFNASKRKLSDGQEEKICELIELCADRGFPMTHSMIYSAATEILKASNPALLPLGKNWVDRFLDRHRDRLQSHWSRSLDTVRANAASPEIVRHFYEKVIVPHIVEPKVAPECLAGMDEVGCTPGANESEVVIGRRGSKNTYKQGTENRENVTAIISIIADGTVNRPLVIFKAKKFQKAWRNNNVAKCTFAHSPNGWTDSEIALGWLTAWDKETEEKAAGRKRVLLLDGHASHIAPAFIRYGLDHNICIIAYPPHTTHILQGLDVACFAIFKKRWSEAVAAHEATIGPIKKADFVGVFGRVVLDAFTSETILSAFSATGIYPYNPDKISPATLGPSVANSVRGSFPQPQSVAVRTVMAAFSTLRPTAFDTDEATHLPAHTSPAASPTHPRTPIPATPSRRRPLTDLDPSLFTPSKRIRTLTAGLASTSASYLVSADRITSAQSRAALSAHTPVLQRAPDNTAEPDWSLIDARDTEKMSHAALQERIDVLTNNLARAKQQLTVANAIIEEDSAQIVIQHLHLNKLTDALHGKENREPTARSHFPKGHGRVLTDEAFVAAVEAEKATQQAESAAKSKRKAARAAKKTRKEENERLWKQWQQEYTAAVAEWEKTCEDLREGGTRVRDLPKRPAAPKGKDLPAIEEENAPEEPESDGEEETW